MFFWKKKKEDSEATDNGVTGNEATDNGVTGNEATDSEPADPEAPDTEAAEHRKFTRIDDRILRQLDTHRLLMYKLATSQKWKTFSVVDFSGNGILFRLIQEDQDIDHYQPGAKLDIRLNFLHTHDTIIEAEAEIIQLRSEQEKDDEIFYIAATYPAINPADKDTIDAFVNSFEKQDTSDAEDKPEAD